MTSVWSDIKKLRRSPKYEKINIYVPYDENLEQDITKRNRKFCFVINNPTENDWIDLEEIEFRYLCFEQEIGESGTPHIQGYVHFKDAHTIRDLSKKLRRAAIFIARGTAAQNRAYCSKDNNGTFQEFGEIPKQGQRNDKLKMSDTIHMPETQIRELFPYQADKLIANKKKLEVLRTPHRRCGDPKLILYIIGDTGAGKSRLGHDFFVRLDKEDIAFDKIDCDGKFMAGYTQDRKPLLWDEFRDEEISHKQFLKICDPWYNPNQNVKNDFAKIDTDVIIITSIIHPEDLYQDKKDKENITGQILRRINIIDMDKICKKDIYSSDVVNEYIAMREFKKICEFKDEIDRIYEDQMSEEEQYITAEVEEFN
nr:putative replication associated protein [Crucivirus sp.]